MAQTSGRRVSFTETCQNFFKKVINSRAKTLEYLVNMTAIPEAKNSPGQPNMPAGLDKIKDEYGLLEDIAVPGQLFLKADRADWFGHRFAGRAYRDRARAAGAIDTHPAAGGAYIDRAGGRQCAGRYVACGGVGKVEADHAAVAGQFQTTIVAVFSAVVAVGVINPFGCRGAGRGCFRDLIDRIFLAGIHTE